MAWTLVLPPLLSSGTGDALFVEDTSDVSHSVAGLGQVDDAPDDASRGQVASLSLTEECQRVKLTAAYGRGPGQTMKTLGERIRELREERDLSLRELAAKIEVSAAFMSDVELGRRYPSDKHMVAVARALGTSLEELQEHDTRPPIREFRRATISNPEYGFAFRQVLDKNISSKDLLEFIRQQDQKKREGGRS